MQRNFDVDVAQVVFAHALQNQPRCVLGNHALEAHADLLAATQIGAGQGVGTAQYFRGAVEHNLTALFAGAGAHVDHAVGRQHHGRVVLHHHQRVAGVAQALHGDDDAVHVTRVQSDAGFVEHKQGVDEAGTECGGEVDALHFAAAQRSALSVECEVADADVAQVFKPCADFFKQQLQRSEVGFAAGRLGVLRIGGIQLHLQRIKEPLQAVQREQHHVVQAQARQRFQLRAGPGHALGHKAFFRRQHGIGLFLVSNAPEQTFRLQPRTATSATGRVAAVLGQQHPDVHLVGLGLQVLEEAIDAEPVLVPLAVPVRRALDHPILLLGRELVPGRVARDACGLGVAHQVVLAFCPSGGLNRLDGAGAQGQLVVGDDQAVVHAHHAAKAAALLTGAHGGVERKHRSDRVGVAQIAHGAVQAGGEAPGGLGLRALLYRVGLVQHIDVEAAAAALQRRLNRFQRARLFDTVDAKAVRDNI